MRSPGRNLKVSALALAAGLSIYFASSGAHAASTDDLLRRLERLEAENGTLRARVQRLEKRPARAAEVQRSAPSAVEQRPLTPSAQSGFDGAYVGVFGSYTASGRQSSGPVNSSGVVGPLGLPTDGLSGGAFGGYGTTLGDIYVGMEGRLAGRDRARKRVADRQFGGANFPFVAATMSSSAPLPPDFQISALSSFGLSSSNSVRQTISNPLGADAAVRLGLVALNDTMVYARLGAGAEVFEGTARNTFSFTTCTAPIIVRSRPSAFEARAIVTGCGASTTTSTSVRTRSQSVSPYLIAGLGVERSFGGAFIRAEAELANYLGSTSSGPLTYSSFWDGRFSLGGGYRW